MLKLYSLVVSLYEEVQIRHNLDYSPMLFSTCMVGTGEPLSLCKVAGEGAGAEYDDIKIP